jgi:hypothetical protein
MMTKLALDGIKVVDFTWSPGRLGVHADARLARRRRAQGRAHHRWWPARSWALRDEFAVGLLGFAGAPMDGSG